MSGSAVATYNVVNDFGWKLYSAVYKIAGYFNNFWVFLASLIAGVYYLFSRLLILISSWIQNPESVSGIAAVVSSSTQEVSSFVNSNPMLAYSSYSVAVDVAVIAVQFIFSTLLMAIPIRLTRTVIHLISPVSSS